MIVVLCGLTAACGISLDPALPSYSIEQTDSAHRGYRRTTLSGAGATYVNDFEEQSLLLMNVDPKEAIGRYGLGGKMCAIAGQDPGAYVAVDVGSEMPAFAVYRNTRQAPFDWRRATFQKMRLDIPIGASTNKETADAGVIEDVLRTLRDGAPVDPPVKAPPMSMIGNASRVHGVLLFGDDLPGLVFRAWIYFDESGGVYLAPDAAVTSKGSEQTFDAAWFPVSDSFAQWARTP